MRTGHLVRDRTVVAEAVEFSDGVVVIRWVVEGFSASTVVWNTEADAQQIHGQDGVTKIIWQRKSGLV